MSLWTKASDTGITDKLEKALATLKFKEQLHGSNIMWKPHFQTLLWASKFQPHSPVCLSGASRLPYQYEANLMAIKAEW